MSTSQMPPSEFNHFSKSDERWEYLREDIEYPVLEKDDFCVFIDKEGDIDWATTEVCEKKMNSAYSQGQKGIFLNKVATLKSYPTEHLSPDQQKKFFIMVGEGLARGFECDAPAAMAMLGHAEEYYIARCQEKARVWYLCASGWSCGIFASLAGFGWLFREWLGSLIGVTATILIICACCGGVGALLSILLRVGNTPLDPATGQSLHYTEAVGRILVGVIAAGIAELAIKVGLFVPFLGEKGTAAFLLISLVAGFSERLLPSIVGRIESISASQKQEHQAIEKE